MSSRSSTFCSPLGASRSASGGCAQAPLRFFSAIFSAGSFSGSERGSVGSTGGRLIDGGVGRDEAARSAAAAAPTMAAAREGFGASSGAAFSGAAFARAGMGASSSSSSLDAAASAGVLTTFVSFPASFPDLSPVLSRCFLRTSCRCFSRRRSSLRARIASSTPAHRSRAIWNTTAKSRPNENCVDRTIDRKRSVRIRMIEPVLLRYSARIDESAFPR